MKKPGYFAAVAIVAIALAAGLVWKRYAAERPLDKAGKVSIAASLTVSPATVWIAQDRGFFTRAGLDATVVECATGSLCAEEMLKGKADLAAAAEFLAARLSFTHKELRILGTTAFVHTIKLLALKERGIASLADLKGKRVGVRLGTNGEYFLARLLVLNGMARGDITWIDMKPQGMADALSAGEVDAVIVWPPFTQKIMAKSPGRLAEFDGQPGQDYYYLMMARQDWLAANGKIAERAMLALKWADEWMAAHPEEAQAYLAAKFGVPLADLADDIQNTRFSIGLPQALLSAMEAESRWLVEQGAKGTPLANSLDLIEFAPLESISPESVTMVHASAARR